MLDGLKAGWLVKQGHRRLNWLRRYCIISPSNLLVYFDSEDCLKLKGHIVLPNYYLAMDEGHLNFTLHKPKAVSSNIGGHDVFHFELVEDEGDLSEERHAELKVVLFAWRDALMMCGCRLKPFESPGGKWFG